MPTTTVFPTFLTELTVPAGTPSTSTDGPWEQARGLGEHGGQRVGGRSPDDVDGHDGGGDGQHGHESPQRTAREREQPA